MTGFTPEEWRTAARVARHSIFTEGNPDLADAWEKAADQAEAHLIPAGGMTITAEQVEDVRLLAHMCPWWSAEHVEQVQARVRSMLPATEPAAVRDGSDLVVVQRSHTAKAVQSWMTLDLWTDLGKNDKDFDAEYERQGFGDLWATLLGEVRVLVQATTPAPAEPAEEETKAEALQNIEVMQWDGTRKSIQAICDWVNSFDDELDDPTISYCFSSAAPDDVLDVSLTTNEGDFVRVSDGDFIVRDTQGNFYRRDRNAYATVAASSPVAPAPTETGPWQDISEAPKHLTLIDRVGDKWTYDGDNWITSETAILPVLYINRKFAPFVAAEEWRP